MTIKHFKPDVFVTRAEMAKMIVFMLGFKEDGDAITKASSSGFTDVPVNQWANSFISVAKNQGIINGKDAENFAPEENVTYEQAVKMLITALGYKPKAAQLGGYPTGYMSVASQLGITKGINNMGGTQLSRAMVAQLAFSSLEAPMLQQVSFGEKEEYVVMDGKNGSVLMTLLNTRIAPSENGNEQISLEGSTLEVMIALSHQSALAEKLALATTKSGQKIAVMYVEDEIFQERANLMIAAGDPRLIIGEFDEEFLKQHKLTTEKLNDKYNYIVTTDKAKEESLDFLKELTTLLK